MAITYGDHLFDSGYHDITPEQEREIEAREVCARLNIDPDAECADGGVIAWMVVDQKLRMQPPAGETIRSTQDGSMEGASETGQSPVDASSPYQQITYWETAANHWAGIAENAVAATREHLSNEIDPEVGFPNDELLRRIHLEVETRGRKNPAFIVTVHHRNIVLSAVAHALRKRGCSWEEWLEACGWPQGSGACECYRPGDCDGSCTHPKSPVGA